MSAKFLYSLQTVSVELHALFQEPGQEAAPGLRGHTLERRLSGVQSPSAGGSMWMMGMTITGVSPLSQLSALVMRETLPVCWPISMSSLANNADPESCRPNDSRHESSGMDSNIVSGAGC
eukprot:CAMPEP_0115119094 /NCGR_PEP_ID=MMETSP0227-20121206/44888_1 /TAXON_ID=89957 /ORGANISM="Polarella glacialis, Strain CCMP 1383" /LENGTH=119 /DNA_ID=CAMNT_0002520501 /DNA_START=44 /DNA_END=403 /DNA_ORIENTATION=-